MPLQHTSFHILIPCSDIFGGTVHYTVNNFDIWLSAGINPFLLLFLYESIAEVIILCKLKLCGSQKYGRS